MQKLRLNDTKFLEQIEKKEPHFQARWDSSNYIDLKISKEEFYETINRQINLIAIEINTALGTSAIADFHIVTTEKIYHQIIKNSKHFTNEKMGSIPVHVCQDLSYDCIVLSKSKYTPDEKQWGIIYVEKLEDVSPIEGPYTIEQIDYHYYHEVTSVVNELYIIDNKKVAAVIARTTSGDKEKMHRIIFLMKNF